MEDETRIRNLEQWQAVHQAKPIHDGAAVQLLEVNLKLDRIMDLLMGADGFIIRLDRLEQKDKGLTRWVERIITPIIAAAVAYAVTVFSPHK